MTTVPPTDPAPRPRHSLSQIVFPRVGLGAALTVAATLGVTLPAPLPARSETGIERVFPFLETQDAPRAETPEAEATEPSLFEEGAKLMLRGLMQEMDPALSEMEQALATLGPAMAELGPWIKDMAELMGDVKNYDTPIRLDNGDILIRRKPDAPPMPDLPRRAPGILPEILPAPPSTGPDLPIPGPDGAIDL